MKEKGKAVYSLGIDLGGTSAKIGVVSQGKILRKTVVPTRADSDYEGILKDITMAAKQLIADYAVEKAGIGSPGLIDVAQGKVCYSNNIRWENVSFRRDIARALGVSVSIANDAKCAALGEALYGAGKGFDRVLMLTLGTGVGGGFAVNGKLAGGSIYADAAETYGHIAVKAGGRKCNCGRRGCFEAYCSATAVAKRGTRAFGTPVDAREVFARARSGDGKAEAIVDEFIEYLACGVISLANALRPQIVVLGGGMSASSDLFLNELNARLEREVYGFAFAPVRAVAAELGSDAGIIGAAAL